jgi:hypothetical protein
MKDFTGYRIFSTSSCVESYNGKIIEKTIRKAFSDDDQSTLYIVKVKGVGQIQLYEDEMIENGGKKDVV